MEIDIVHDMQESYRKLLYSMSRPGIISALTQKKEPWIPCHPGTFLTALTLLDAEVSFHVVADKQNLGNILSEYTFARWESVEKADYIFVPNGTEEAEMIGAMKESKIGNLLDPQLSATWIIETDEIVEDGALTLTGPGIKDETPLHIQKSDLFWKMREEKIKEYPLGIDLIFTDTNSKLVCIPRTTNVKVERRVM
jgi:alpha-D-ribose 1-methylphosphonate 5-triphosphate synthase subunit PhnH